MEKPSKDDVSGVLAKYQLCVSSASNGAVTLPELELAREYYRERILWWINKKDVLLDIASKTSNSIVYNKKSIEKSITKLNEIESIDRLFYAMKANFQS